MANVKFNYEEVKSIYESIKSIIGNAGDSSSIAGILTSMDKEYKNRVQVKGEAIYGNLGEALLTDWENTSSVFPKFVEKFQSWASIIASTSNNYQELEQKIKGFGTQLNGTGSGKTTSVNGSATNNKTGAVVAEIIMEKNNDVSSGTGAKSAKQTSVAV